MQASTIENGSPVIEKVFKPTFKQEEFVRIPDSIFEALGGGAAGGGKTDLGIMIPPLRQFTEHPKFKGLVLRRTFPDLEKEIVPRQHEWYPHMGAVYNETKKVWKFPSGAKIQNGHAEREDDVRKYDSAEYNYIDWDESTHFTGFQYLYLSISRCRSSSADLPAIVRSFSNPGNVGHSFFKKRFVDPWKNGRRILVDPVSGLKRIYLPFLGKDNEHLLKNDPGYLRRLEGLPEVEKKAKLYGSWDAYSGQMFDEFRVARLPDEPANALHVIPSFPIPDYWPKILAMDWGYKAMTFVIWGAVAPSGRLFIYRTAWWRETDIAIWAPEVYNISKNANETFKDVVICHSAGQHRGEPSTIQEQVHDAFEGRYDVRLGEKDRVGGVQLLHEYLRWKQKPRPNLPELKYDAEAAARILRMRGDAAYAEYLSLFAPQADETNIPKLQILDESPEGTNNQELIDVIPACVPAEHNPEDVEEFEGDDPYDALRMIITAASKFVSHSQESLLALQAREELVNSLKGSADMTAFYRQARAMESANRPKMVRRFHKAKRNAYV